MGACFVGSGYDGKLTYAQALVAFRADQEQAGHEHGHNGYSGSIYELHDIKREDVTFATYRDAEEVLSKKGTKGVAHVVMIKVIDTAKSKRIQTLRAKNSTIFNELQNAIHVFRVTAVVTSERQKKALADKITKLRQKADLKQGRVTLAIHEIENKLAEKSKKTAWIFAGWASE